MNIPRNGAMMKPIPTPEIGYREYKFPNYVHIWIYHQSSIWLVFLVKRSRILIPSRSRPEIREPANFWSGPFRPGSSPAGPGSEFNKLKVENLPAYPDHHLLRGSFVTQLGQFVKLLLRTDCLLLHPALFVNALSLFGDRMLLGGSYFTEMGPFVPEMGSFVRSSVLLRVTWWRYCLLINEHRF